MRAALRKKFGAELRERRRELAASFKRNQEANRKGNDDGPLDLADTATELYTQEFNYSLSENERSRLLMIDEALERVESGEYGECQDCGEAISEARLKAIPGAPYCIECQEKREAGGS
jgi:DnaK suppressor protein